METKLDRGDYSDYSTASKVTLGDLFKRYINEDKHKKKIIIIFFMCLGNKQIQAYR